MITIRQIKVLAEEDFPENILKVTAKKLGIKTSDVINYEIIKKSIDARDKNKIYFVYELDINVKDSVKIKKQNDVQFDVIRKYILPKCGDKKLTSRPVVVGSGPAGLFAAYVLCEKGFKPLVIERGEKMEDRIKTVDKFWTEGVLNLNSNVQFGEGGAGTFSDGKLNTLIKDNGNYFRKVFETFVKFGAPKEILYDNKPHIGTDILQKVIINMRQFIINSGGEFLYNTCLTDIVYENENVKKIIVNDSDEIKTEVLILAIGHSSRDTIKMLYEKKIKMEAKPFAVGVRISHLQDDINLSQYGEKYSKILKPASYKLTYQTSQKRGVYTFCMCPGGYVVNASSENEKLAINGMSYYRRDSKNANSAVIVTITPDDFGYDVLDGIKYQRKLEQKAYEIGNGLIPVQLYRDFKNNKLSNEFGSIKPVFKGQYTFGNIRDIFAEDICLSLIEAIDNFGTKIKGFNNDDVLLAGVESRTSSPVRIIRGEDMQTNVKGIYPVGEGAGYAGGITSSSIDGIKAAEAIIQKYYFL